MAADDFFVFAHALEEIHKGNVDFENDSFRMVLVADSYTPNQLTDDAWSDISADEVANGGGYSTNGETLAVTVSRSGNIVTVDCDNQVWSSATITAKYAVIVRDADANGTLAASDLPISFVDLLPSGGSASSTNGDFSVTINANGVFRSTAAIT
ncbi:MULTISPECIES: hypothetical protein [Halocynthiibacter]|uniref:Uncharacterized protein n=1 Tax=Halocynthiibacter halioticoli TaxID=2986804 RepID=A0AAE3LUV2_9RHOB|nr:MULTISPECIES: hypothetical protein [Halocynthiibacter]MCV6825990.1 hypothetical protein [Halocynthiibacter halioticoli]MCW4058991.1 hypothetical protein [Halocynthiibacter sp. SDUM655004]